MVVVPAPLDRKHASGKLYVHRTIGSTGSGGAYSGGAGSRSAGARDARATFPNTKLDRAVVSNFGKRDVGAFREKPMMLKFGAECRQIIALGIANPEDAMRVADVDGAWLGQHTTVGRGEGQIDSARISGGLCQRYFIPCEAGCAHIDGYTAVFADPSEERSGARLDGDPAAPKASLQQRCHTTAGVPAGANLGTVGIQDTHEHISGARRFQHDDLIAAYAACSIGDRACRACGRPDRFGASVDHHEVVAEAVHLYKGKIPQIHAFGALFSPVGC